MVKLLVEYGYGVPKEDSVCVITEQMFNYHTSTNRPWSDLPPQFFHCVEFIISKVILHYSIFYLLLNNNLLLK